MVHTLVHDESISRKLARTWPYFFAPYGRLTPIQRASVPPILEGRDVLVIAATASGKTEAACAPLVERYVGNPHPWTVLYISPTRALVNDLFERLQLPLEGLSLRLQRRTGEYRPSAGHHPNVLLSTPESFDSMLCRGRSLNPEGHLLATVCAVVLDEVHLLHGTARGEQVCWLLERLRRLRTQAFRSGWTGFEHVQLVGLSATVPDPDDVIRKFLPNGECVFVPGGRNIEVVTPPNGSGDVLSMLPSYLAASTRPEKVLIFANSRRRVDELAAILRQKLAPHNYQVRAHHGSLDKAEREETEEAARRHSRVVIVATSTLEIGVDIGDIDLVVLESPPPDIPSLLQRIGRGNRRGDTTRVMASCAGPLDTLINAAMIDAARDGWLGNSERGPQHAVARQQVASYIFQAPRRGRPRVKVQEFVDSNAPPVLSNHLIQEMLRSGELVEDQQGLSLGPEWLDKTTRGEIHSCIEDAGGSSVVDELSGRVIAHGIRQQSGRGIQTGGHLLEVRKWTDFKIEVRRASNEALAVGNWRYSSQPRMQGAGQPEAVRRYLGLADTEWPVIPGERVSYCFHFGGARRRAAIMLAAGATGRPPSELRINDWYLELSDDSLELPSWLRTLGRATLDLTISSRLDELERLLGRPLVNKHIPLEARADEVRGWLKLEKELEDFHRARLVSVEDEALSRVLSALQVALSGRRR